MQEWRLAKTVEEVIRSCIISSNSDRTKILRIVSVETTPWPMQPWIKLAVDTRGPDRSARFAAIVGEQVRSHSRPNVPEAVL